MNTLYLKRSLAVCILGLALVVARIEAQTAPTKVEPQPHATPVTNAQKPIVQEIGEQVEIVFALDTTGSMSGLIQGAKQKIWSIVNEIATAKPTPTVKIGFVAYRDKGDAYVTQVSDLTADLDAAFATLSQMQAAGGGDLPEHVNKALHDAVHEIHWSDPKQAGNVFQVIFLVGDCPPHMDYQDNFNYKTHTKEAIARGIMTNAIRCGNNAQTQPIWQEIAQLGDGRYFSIAQEGGVVAISTPFDAQISKTADAIEATTVSRGGVGSRAYGAKTKSAAANAALGPTGAMGAAGPAAQSERASFNTKSAQVYGDWDIVTQAMNDGVKVEDLKDEELPENLRKMTPDERAKFIKTKIQERRNAQSQLLELQKKRQAFIDEYMTKNKLNDKNAFDVLVSKAIREQAARRNIHINP